MFAKLKDYVDRLQQQKIMLIGDMVADVYLNGKISRISREAPVLILEHAGETIVPGGAANAVYNAAALGGSVYAVGVVGQDHAGAELRKELQQKKVQIEGLFTAPDRPTITKTRVMAGGQATVRQQVVRIDKEAKLPLGQELEAAVIRYVDSHIDDTSVVVLSDYGSHTISREIARYVIAACRTRGIPSIVDSRYNIHDYSGITVVKQNESEAAAAIGCPALDDQTLLVAGRELLRRLNAAAVLITRGPDGMTLFENTGAVTHIPVVNKSEVYDVTGAGDTVVATVALALAAGASYQEAAELATFAAGVVVRKPGTATTTPDELKTAIGEYHEQHHQP